jgi:hypothetical protein
MIEPRSVDVGDFLEADANAPVETGVYRVVGTPADADALVCLRVTDADGKRSNTGDLVRVDADAASALEPASEPRTTAAGFVKNQLEGPYWLIRSLLPF